MRRTLSILAVLVLASCATQRPRLATSPSDGPIRDVAKAASDLDAIAGRVEDAAKSVQLTLTPDLLPKVSGPLGELLAAPASIRGVGEGLRSNAKEIASEDKEQERVIAQLTVERDDAAKKLKDEQDGALGRVRTRLVWASAGCFLLAPLVGFLMPGGIRLAIGFAVMGVSAAVAIKVVDFVDRWWWALALAGLALLAWSAWNLLHTEPDAVKARLRGPATTILSLLRLGRRQPPPPGP